MTKRPKDVVFLLGPSGAGKTFLAELLQGAARLVHIRIDRYPEGDGIDLENLRSEWDAFWLGGDASGLAAELRERAEAGGHAGVVLSFPSRCVIPPERIVVAEREGITTCLLFGPGEACREAFVSHERASAVPRVSGDPVLHWEANNRSQYQAFSHPAYDSVRLPTFEEGKRVQPQDLLRAIRFRLSRRASPLVRPHSV